jgi:hypothetical protein
MKRLFITFIVFILSAISVANSAPTADHPLIKDCKIEKKYGFVSETFELWGNVKIITDPKKFATFDVNISKEYADLYVKLVDNPNSCGQWRWVDDEKDADFTIRIVDESEDFSICFVDADPGTAY